nr:flagellar biosynthetic protein FliO [Marinobacter algicola]
MARMHLSAARSGIPGALLAVFIPAQTYAQEQEGPAREAAATAPDTLATMLTLGVGLLAVIAIIFGCAWIVRRMSGMTGGNTRAIKVVSVMPMGTRERIALVEVGDKQILIGVTPSAIRTLHVFDEPVVSAGEPVSSDFARKLQGMIGKSWGSGSSPKEGS